MNLRKLYISKLGNLELDGSSDKVSRSSRDGIKAEITGESAGHVLGSISAVMVRKPISRDGIRGRPIDKMK